jgi:hypothetical protein
MKIFTFVFLGLVLVTAGCGWRAARRVPQAVLEVPMGDVFNEFRTDVRDGNLKRVKNYVRFPLIVRGDSDLDAVRRIGEGDFEALFSCFLREDSGFIVDKGGGELSFGNQKMELLNGRIHLSSKGDYARIGGCGFERIGGSWQMVEIYSNCCK